MLCIRYRPLILAVLVWMYVVLPKISENLLVIT